MHIWKRPSKAFQRIIKYEEHARELDVISPFTPGKNSENKLLTLQFHLESAQIILEDIKRRNNGKPEEVVAHLLTICIRTKNPRQSNTKRFHELRAGKPVEVCNLDPR